MNIPINKIVPNPEQPRRDFPSDEMESLASSIRQHGLINPIAVEEAGGGLADPVYILIDGERRWRAARMAGLTEIPAEVRPALNGSGVQDRLVLALVANLQRQDMNPIEQARAVRRLAEQGLSNVAIAHKLGKYPTWVANRLNLLDLDEEIQDFVAAGHLPADVTVVNALRSIKSLELRLRTARRLARPGQTIKVVESVCVKVSRAEHSAQSGAANAEMTIPSLDVARRVIEMQASGPIELKRLRERWDLFSAVGQVPPWAMVETQARDTCQACAIYDVASEKNCRDCPLVDHLRRLIETVNTGRG